MMDSLLKLHKKAHQTAKFLKEHDDYLLIGHYDADGLCSTAVIAKALEREGKRFEVKTVKKVDDEVLKYAAQSDKSHIVFVDLGSSALDMLGEHLTGRSVLIIDHHECKESKFMQLNGREFGFDGDKEISSSGTAYLVARIMNRANYDMSHLAVVGAVGDMQAKEGKLVGLNRVLLEEAESVGTVQSTIDLIIYGRQSRPLAQMLAYCFNPYIPGLSGNENACYMFLNDLKIDLKREEKWRTYEDLSTLEKKKLFNALIIWARHRDVLESELKELIGETYTLPNEERGTVLRDASEFATLLNSCGRHDAAEVSIKICGGDRDVYYKKALNLLNEHRKSIRDGIEWVVNKGLVDEELYYFFDAGEEIKESVVGIVAGLVYAGRNMNKDKPIFGLATVGDGTIKISGRSSKKLVDLGLNLNDILSEAASKVDGFGGGHFIAAGATIPEGRKEEFFTHLRDALRARS